MNTNFRLGLLSIAALGLTIRGSVALAQEGRSAAEPSSAAAAERTSGDAAAPAESATNLPPLTLNQALQKIATAPPRYPAHPPVAEEGEKSPAAQKKAPASAPKFVMATPPPAPRTEKKPAPPAPDYVWVPGHYMPLEGQWRWVTGEWAVPATPTSVWIAAAYDEKTKTWNPGYWQPDRPAPTEAAPAPKSEPAAKPNGY